MGCFTMAESILPYQTPSSEIGMDNLMYTLLADGSIQSMQINPKLPDPKGFIPLSVSLYCTINGKNYDFVLPYKGSAPTYGTLSSQFQLNENFEFGNKNIYVKYTCYLKLVGRNITLSNVSVSGDCPKSSVVCLTCLIIT